MHRLIVIAVFIDQACVLNSAFNRSVARVVDPTAPMHPDEIGAGIYFIGKITKHLGALLLGLGMGTSSMCRLTILELEVFVPPQAARNVVKRTNTIKY